MCLAIPGKIIALLDEDPSARLGKVSFGGIVKEVNLTFVPEANIGDYVIVHVGFAISHLDEKEATRVFEYLKAMGDLSEIGEIP